MNRIRFRNAKAVVLAICMGAALAGCKTPKEPVETDLVLEENDDIDVIGDMEKAGIVLEQESYNENLYKIVKSSTGKYSSINDYFEEKGIVPIYDLKCTPETLEEMLENTEVSNNSIWSVIDNNTNINDQYKKKIKNVIDNNPFDTSFPWGVVKINLSHMTIKSVVSDEKYYSRFDPINCCIYINNKYVTNAKEEEFALAHAIFGYASTNAYVNVDGKKVYCNLTDFCYDKESDSLYEIGKSYSEYVAYDLTLNSKADGRYYDIELPAELAKKIYSFTIASAGCDKGHIWEHTKDFSYNLNCINIKKDRAYPEYERLDFANLMLKVDNGDMDALAILGSKIEYGAYETMQDSYGWLQELDSYKEDVLSRVSNYTDAKVRK